ncbi:18119_t:CDS:2, partial [Gigaspora margarita]
NNDSNIIHLPLPQLTDSNQEFMYKNNAQINISGLIWFNNEIQDMQFDDNSAPGDYHQIKLLRIVKNGTDKCDSIITV